MEPGGEETAAGRHLGLPTPPRVSWCPWGWTLPCPGGLEGECGLAFCPLLSPFSGYHD